MDPVVAVVLFVIGVALGMGGTWLFFRRVIDAAREQERLAALANNRALEERLAAKEDTLTELRSTIAEREDVIRDRDGEIQRLRQHYTIVATELKKDREQSNKTNQLLDTVEKRFKDAFAVLATDALKNNNEEFAKLADPVTKSLKEIDNKIAIVQQSATNLGAETGKLVRALQKPEVRGQWGEMHLVRVVELCGMTERCDFDQQQVIGDGEIVQRPDLVIHLPGERHLPVDAKAPVKAFLDSAEAIDDTSRQNCLQQFVSHVRDHVRTLGSKAYYQNMAGAPEFVVLYLPTEAIFSAALTLDGQLLEYAARFKVHLAGPTALMSILRSAAYDWKQEELGKHAKEICELGEELYNRVATFGGHMGKLGLSLKKSVDTYNQAVGSLETRVLSQARKFEQLGAASNDARIADLATLEVVPRELQRVEFSLSEESREVTVDGTLERPR